MLYYMYALFYYAVLVTGYEVLKFEIVECRQLLGVVIIVDILAAVVVLGGGSVKSLLCVAQGVVRPSDSFRVCYKITQ